jgi:uncharacterized protein YoxC
MTKSTIPPAECISQSFKELTESAARLNAESDELAKAIAPIDAALKTLNLGVVAWHTYAGTQDEAGDYWAHRVGYAKVGGKWGLAISDVSGSIYHGDDYEEAEWLFNDAPRWMRIKAVDHIPQLLDELVKQTNKVAADLHEKTKTARELANTVASLPNSQGRR